MREKGNKYQQDKENTIGRMENDWRQFAQKEPQPSVIEKTEKPQN